MGTRSPRRILSEVSAIITDGHFVYTSGKHGPAYINKDAIYPYADYTSYLCLLLAQRFADDRVDVVVAPAVGAVILSQWMAYHLTKFGGSRVFGVYADKDGDGFVIKRGYEKLIPNRRILIVEDLFTTGGSVLKVVEVVRALQGNVIGVAGIANRGGVTGAEVGGIERLETLIDVKMEMFDEQDCPLCKAGVPINTQLGHGRHFLEKQKQKA